MSYLFDTVLSKVQRSIAELRWPALFVIAAGHLGLTWVGLKADGEAALTGPLTFLYFYATTATTVGYGDLSPTSQGGRLIAILWLFPGAIALFTAVLSKSITSISTYWRRRMTGQADYSQRAGLTVIVGFPRARCLKVINELRRGARGRQDDDILVVAKRDLQPLPDGVLFVRVDQLSEAAGLRRAGIALADEVIINGEDDDETLAATLAIQTIAGAQTHLVAHFQSEDSARLLRGLARPIETVVSPSVELLVRAAQDPGASRLFTALASSTDSRATLYSLVLDQTMSLADLRDRLFQGGGALIAVQTVEQEDFHLPKAGHPDLKVGDRIYYMAPQRLSVKGA